jgi:hypothetical protein
MEMLVIRCPATGRTAPTGIRLSRRAFAMTSIAHNNRLACPHCGDAHFWGPHDAWVEDVGGGDEPALHERP